MYLYYELCNDRHEKFYRLQWDEVVHSGSLCYRLKLFWGRLGSSSEGQVRDCTYFDTEASLFAAIKKHHTRRMKHGYVRKAYVPIHKQVCFEFMETPEQLEFDLHKEVQNSEEAPSISYERGVQELKRYA